MVMTLKRRRVFAGNAYIMTPPKNTTANEGTRVKLNCQAEGYPNNITYRWFKNGEDVNMVRIHGYCCALTWVVYPCFELYVCVLIVLSYFTFQ